MKSNKFHLFTCLSSAVFIVALAVQFVFSFHITNKANSIKEKSNLFFSESHSHSSKPVSENNIFSPIDELEEDEKVNEKSVFPVLIFSILLSTYHIKETDNSYISQSLIVSVSSIPLHIRNCIYLI